MLITNFYLVFFMLFVCVNLVAPNSAPLVPAVDFAATANINALTLLNTDLIYDEAVNGPLNEEGQNIGFNLHKRDWGELFGGLAAIASEIPSNVAINNAGKMKGNFNGSVFFGGNGFASPKLTKTSSNNKLTINNIGDFEGDFNGSIIDAGFQVSGASSPKVTKTTSKRGAASPRLQSSPSRSYSSPDRFSRTLSSDLGRFAIINNNMRSSKGKYNGVVVSAPPRGGSFNVVQGGLITWHGKYLKFDENGLRVTVVSSRTQNVALDGARVYVNDQLVCDDVTKLEPGARHQMRSDGSAWCTNLVVGRAMSVEEKKMFEEKVKKIEAVKRAREAAFEEKMRERKREREAAWRYAWEKKRKMVEAAQRKREAAMRMWGPSR